MSIIQVEPEVIETVTDEDFSYPEHVADWLVIGGTEQGTVKVCRVCGKTEVHPAAEKVNDLGGQDLAPRFGADEYLSW